MTNMTQVEGKFQQFKGKLKEKYGKLTDNDLALYEGKKDQFFGRVKELYGLGKEEAEKACKDLEKSCGYCSTDKAA